MRLLPLFVVGASAAVSKFDLGGLFEGFDKFDLGGILQKEQKEGKKDIKEKGEACSIPHECPGNSGFLFPIDKIQGCSDPEFQSEVGGCSISSIGLMSGETERVFLRLRTDATLINPVVTFRPLPRGTDNEEERDQRFQAYKTLEVLAGSAEALDSADGWKCELCKTKQKITCSFDGTVVISGPGSFLGLQFQFVGDYTAVATAGELPAEPSKEDNTVLCCSVLDVQGTVQDDCGSFQQSTLSVFIDGPACSCGST
uniref:Uncharacterized protein n=1 Tax=Chromera velia CCMP2878 TaxID=1169474 RepID=A0A0G4I7X4_9ALVE|mmetsp:Transcript_47285/g.93310  ORF Transcript_47285/g.93310 Transcript_47285/m.93310 type:complete len:256 (-) Transcript_47285:448-1215(-)|eukprot:Cvel_11707.t1-p1 / transcript=Cvel_11707.t1 / gene=Cvel_11707 / organism=Chromera_velia_CCMP2878 / gene_product=hypothetical protein / transcript_product=hypothetical protein / location=Cvel_scaffold743:11967-13536(+) / protein_length=255 / sequence_SO=supercontig / SO=protein_coding / is_pseudo=false